MKIILLFPTIAEIPASFYPEKKLCSDQVYPVCGAPTASFICTGPSSRIANAFHTLDPKAYDLAIVVGYSGALQQNLKVGDIVLCNQVLAENKTALQAETQLVDRVFHALSLQDLSIWIGSSYTSTKVVSHKADKQHLQSTGALVVEMENYWAMQAAQEIHLPCISVRIVLDPLDYHLPDLSCTLLPNGQISYPKTLLHLMAHPKDWISVFQILKMTRQIAPTWSRVCTAIAQ